MEIARRETFMMCKFLRMRAPTRETIEASELHTIALHYHPLFLSGKDRTPYRNTWLGRRVLAYGCARVPAGTSLYVDDPGLAAEADREKRSVA